jgi:hypothetical protein
MVKKDCVKRAVAKYKREKCKQLTVIFYPADIDLYEYLQKQANKNFYVKNLIRKDMQK